MRLDALFQPRLEPRARPAGAHAGAPRHAGAAAGDRARPRRARLAGLGATRGPGRRRGRAGAGPQRPPCRVDPRPLPRRRRCDRPRHLRRRGLLPRRAARGRRRLRDDAGAARRRGSGRLLRPAPLRAPRRTRAGDGLLPLRQRRDRGRACDPRARRRAGLRPRLGRPPRQRNGGGLPRPLRCPLRQHPPGRDLSRQRTRERLRLRRRARATRSTCPSRPAPRRSCGSRCWSTS